ncbi:hypothetical protein PAPHI01_1062 [Pancytospora philotis]|nr:hypothetical protein PAPHI01_1062 [Pancytospora philotis]
MSHRYIGSYKDAASAPSGRAHVLIATPDGHKCFVSTPAGISYTLKERALCFRNSCIALEAEPVEILVTEKYAIVQYRRKLVFHGHDGALRRVFISDNIVHDAGLWMVNDPLAYIVDAAGDTVFTKQQERVQGFTANGEVLYLAGGLDGNPPAHLVVESLKSRTAYCEDSEPLVSMDQLSIYLRIARIENVVAASRVRLARIGPSRELAEVVCPAVLTDSHFFLIAGDYIVRKSLAKQYTHFEPASFAVHDLVSGETVYDAVAALCCCMRIRVAGTSCLENMLCHSIIKSMPFDLLVENIKVNCALDYEAYEARRVAEQKPLDQAASILQIHAAAPPISAMAVLCRAYRRVDDRGKALLERHIEPASLSADELQYIIIYKPHLLEEFVWLCIRDSRLFYLRDLADFYSKAGKFPEIQAVLLKRGLLLHDYPGLEKIVAMEKAEVDAQELCYKAFLCSREAASPTYTSPFNS